MTYAFHRWTSQLTVRTKLYFLDNTYGIVLSAQLQSPLFTMILRFLAMHCKISFPQFLQYNIRAGVYQVIYIQGKVEVLYSVGEMIQTESKVPM